MGPSSLFLQQFRWYSRYRLCLGPGSIRLRRSPRIRTTLQPSPRRTAFLPPGRTMIKLLRCHGSPIALSNKARKRASTSSSADPQFALSKSLGDASCAGGATNSPLCWCKTTIPDIPAADLPNSSLPTLATTTGPWITCPRHVRLETFGKRGSHEADSESCCFRCRHDGQPHCRTSCQCGC